MIEFLREIPQGWRIAIAVAFGLFVFAVCRAVAQHRAIRRAIKPPQHNDDERA